jgi:Ca-activated chloride channel homolog
MRLTGLFRFLVPCALLTACWQYSSVDGASAGGGPGDIYPGTEKSSQWTPNRFESTAEDSFSTFGLDVDKAAFAWHRKKVMQEGALPEPGSVRTEEYLNWFGFASDRGQGDEVFRVDVETARTPYRDSLIGLRIGLDARDIGGDEAPWNLTILVDVSGSMTGRLDLVKKSLGHLVDAMRAGDRVSIATYAGRVSTVLEPTDLGQKDRAALKSIIADMKAGGGTAMSDGLVNAYRVNRMGFIEGGVNRVIVCSDGDANIGATGWEDMLAKIRQYKDQGITLSTLGFGSGNYSDENMEMLADRGNGNYYYIDSESEARRLFTEELTGMMRVVAWDAKIQVAFRAEAVKSYRLIGYENRAIHDSDFKQDTTDAGEIGAGHTVTALYELVLADPAAPLGTASLRYKDASGSVKTLVRPLGAASGTAFAAASGDFRFAFAVAEYAEILRRSPFVQTRLSDVAATLRGIDPGGDAKRIEFAQIVDRAATLRAQ